jgi:hypothetical protein
MTLAVDAISAAQTATGTSISWSHTSAGSHRVGIAWLAAVNHGSITAATWGGTAMTLVGTISNGGNAVFLYRLVAQGTGAQTVSFTCSGSANLVAGSISLTGVDQITPHGTAATATGAVSPASVTVGSVGSTDMVLDCVHDNNGLAMTVGADQTENAQGSSGSVVGGSSRQLGSAGGVMSWTVDGLIAWAIVAAAFKQAVINTDAIRIAGNNREAALIAQRERDKQRVSAIVKDKE